jgi:hypothetical protein
LHSAVFLESGGARGRSEVSVFLAEIRTSAIVSWIIAHPSKKQ